MGRDAEAGDVRTAHVFPRFSREGLSEEVW